MFFRFATEAEARAHAAYESSERFRQEVTVYRDDHPQWPWIVVTRRVA